LERKGSDRAVLAVCLCCHVGAVMSALGPLRDTSTCGRRFGFSVLPQPVPTILGIPAGNRQFVAVSSIQKPSSTTSPKTKRPAAGELPRAALTADPLARCETAGELGWTGVSAGGCPCVRAGRGQNGSRMSNTCWP
jgi:hypothetical protein